MRSQCPTTSTKRCCGRKFCIVTPISKIDEDYDLNANVTALDYMEGQMEVINQTQIKITIPFNKILSEVYYDWFINDTFDGEYFPLESNVADKLGLNNIAFSEGRYPVIETASGYVITINYEIQH